MRKPDDIPQSVWEIATDISMKSASSYEGNAIDVAYALMAARAEERAACCRVAWDHAEHTSDDAARFVARNIASVISQRT